MARSTGELSPALAGFLAAMAVALGQAGEAMRVRVNAGPPAETEVVRRDWAVVLYSGDCPEHPGILCAMQVISPCTLEETDRVAAAVNHSVPGFVPHRCAVLDPADFLGG